ncbi:F-box-like domain-containing protein, partial [Vibrio cholerae]
MDVLREILLHLDIPTLVKLGQVSKLLKVVVSDDTLWTKLCHR